jgi:hypothetical protein
MRSAVNPEINRTITGAEVMKWFMRGRKPWPAEELCDGIALRLNKMHWPADPPSPLPAPHENDPWWDSEKAAGRAKALLDDIPAMLRHWRRVHEGFRMKGAHDETRRDQQPVRLRGGYNAIKRLRGALDAAVPYIEFPLGQYERRDHRTLKRPSLWHAHAVAITPIIADALRQSGRRVSTTHNSAMVRIVREALVRIGHDDNITPDRVAAHLTDWYAKFGRSF